MKRMMTTIGLVLLAMMALACESGDKKADTKPADKKMEKPAEKKAEKKAEKPAEKKAEKPADKKMEKPAEKKAPDAVATDDGKGGLLVKSELYNVKFTVPKGWKIDKSPTGISVSSPDDGVLMVVAGSKSQDLAEAALNDLKANLKFKDVNVEKQGTAFLNGLAGLRGEGDATLVEEGDKESQIHFVAFATKLGDKAVTTLIFSSKERYSKDIETIEGILATLDKL